MDMKTWLDQNPVSSFPSVEDALEAAYRAGQAHATIEQNTFYLDTNPDMGHYHITHDTSGWMWSFTELSEAAIISGPYPNRREAIKAARADAASAIQLPFCKHKILTEMDHVIRHCPHRV